MTSRFPEKAAELWAYQTTILHAAHAYEGANWVAYDRLYRREMLAKKDLNWSVPNARLYSEAFTGRAKRHLPCPHSRRTIWQPPVLITRTHQSWVGYRDPHSCSSAPRTRNYCRAQLPYSQGQLASRRSARISILAGVDTPGAGSYTCVPTVRGHMRPSSAPIGMRPRVAGRAGAGSPRSLAPTGTTPMPPLAPTRVQSSAGLNSTPNSSWNR